LNGSILPFERNPEITEVFVDGNIFGFGISRVTAVGRESTAVMWQLDKAERPLPSHLTHALERYQ
jgi:hypothetical protein